MPSCCRRSAPSSSATAPWPNSPPSRARTQKLCSSSRSRNPSLNSGRTRSSSLLPFSGREHEGNPFQPARVSRAEERSAACRRRAKEWRRDGENFLRLVLRNGRADILPEISRLFEEMKERDEGVVEASVASAFPLVEDQLRQLAAKLEKDSSARFWPGRVSTRTLSAASWSGSATKFSTVPCAASWKRWRPPSRNRSHHATQSLGNQ